MVRCHSKHMENNDSPYIYEKPLRSSSSKSVKRAKRLAGLSGLGLVGVVGIFGGSAFANTMVASAKASEPEGVSAPEARVEQSSVTNQNLLTDEPSSSAPSADSVLQLPLQQAQPKPNAVKVQLPNLPSQSYGNTSGATPTAGSYATGSNSNSSYSKFAEQGDREKYGSAEREVEYEDD